MFLFAAITALMAHAFIPHHEHGEIICFEQVHVDDFSHDESAGDVHVCCLDAQDAIRIQNRNDFGLGCYNILCAFHFPPLLLFLGSFFDLGDVQPDIINKPYLNLYTSIVISSSNSLRGPPLA